MRWGTPGKTRFGAIVWKELRETYKWGIPALGLACIAASDLVPAAGSMEGIRIDIPTTGYLAAFLLGTAAFIIGWFQASRDSENNAWDFLVHRPARRSTLFWGKVTAGLGIYLVTTCAPLLAVTAWLATPGHVAQPYDWRMALPLAVDLLIGLACYFTALFGGMRQRRWFPSVGVALFAAFIFSMAVSNIDEFRAAFGLSAVGLAVMAVAARATFVAGGRYVTQPVAGRLTSAIPMVISLVLAGFLVTELLFVAPIASRLPSPGEALPYLPRSDGSVVHGVHMKSYYPTGDGTIVQAIPDAYGTPVAYDLEDRPIERFKDWHGQDDSLEKGIASLSLELPTESADLDDSSVGYRSTTSFFERLDPPVWDSRKLEHESWYYVHNQSLIAGYDHTSRNLLGWLGPGGYTAGATPPASRFEGPLLVPRHYRQGNGDMEFGTDSKVLAFSAVAYRIDFASRQVEAIFKAPTGEPIVAAGHQRVEILRNTYGEGARFDVIATTKAIYVQTRDGASVLAVARDPQAAGYGSVRVIRALQSADRPWFIWYRQYFSQSECTQPDQVTVVNKDGVSTGHYTLSRERFEQPNQANQPIPWLPALADAGRIPITVSAAMAVMQVWDLPLLRDGSFNAALSPSSPRWLKGAGWSIAILVAFFSATLNYVFARKFALSRRRLWFWTGMGILLGPLGFALMLTLLEWPIFERCPECRRGRVATRSHCEHCGAPFRPPERDGSEIFEHAG